MKSQTKHRQNESGPIQSACNSLNFRLTVEDSSNDLLGCRRNFGPHSSLNQHTPYKRINTFGRSLSYRLGSFRTLCTDKKRTIGSLVVLLFALPAFGQTPDSPQPKWLDTQTKMELSASALAFAADGWTTRRNYVNANAFCNANNRVGCFTEYNPLLRPIVDSDLKTSAYFAGAFGAQVGANWLLRKHPRERHILNWAVIGTETFWASYNTIRRRF